MKLKYSLFLILTFVTLPTFAKITLPAIISDNMVVQRESEILLWGSGSGKILVKPSWGEKSYNTDCDAQGKWLVEIQTPALGVPYKIDFTDDDGTVTVVNVLAGEVWLCSGQSNMQFNLSRAIGGETEAAVAKGLDIRLFTIEPAHSTEPQDSCNGKWEPCEKDVVRLFSAVGYFFGKELNAKLGVPIGLIDNSWGGTPAESWVKKEVLSGDEELKPILERDMQILADQDVYQKQYDQMLAQWKQQVELAKSSGKKAPSRPYPPGGLRPQNRSCRLYNAMVHPILNYKIKGVVWYQGESNAGRAYQYRKLFSKLIENWRDDWRQPEMPFYFVQLASFYKQQPSNHPAVWPQKDTPKDDTWAELREAQTMALKLSNTGMACAIDLGEPYDIHPRNKRELGRRLSLWALNETYGFNNILVSGPLYKSMKIEGEKIRISFDYVGNALDVKGQKFEGFAIAGDNRNFVWADAVIDGESVVVYSDEVDEPVAVRYGWVSWPYCNLYNDQRLPAVPFRTDSWKALTDDFR